MDTNRLTRSTKPRACESCHQRKVRCDGSLVGFPCSACSARKNGEHCTPLIRRKPKKRKRVLADDDQCSQVVSPSEEVRGAMALHAKPLISEDDAQVHTLRHMSAEHSTSLSTPLEGQQVIQYYSPLNALAVLGETIGHGRRRRLVPLDLSIARKDLTARERECCHLEADDLAYLKGKRIFEYPPKHVW